MTLSELLNAIFDTNLPLETEVNILLCEGESIGISSLKVVKDNEGKYSKVVLDPSEYLQLDK
jgi:hypothetical protein